MSYESTGTIRGVVHDLETGMGLEAATVQIFPESDDEKRVATTDGKGRFSFLDVDVGPVIPMAAIAGKYITRRLHGHAYSDAATFRHFGLEKRNPD